MASSGSGKWRDWAVSPGEILAEALEERRMSQSELARRMGRPIKTINEIVRGKTAITPDTAIQLELTLGIEAGLWNNLETSYRAHQAEERSASELEASADWARQFPFDELVDVGLIKPATTTTGRVRELLAFFGVGSHEAWEQHWAKPVASFRASQAHSPELPAVAAWLRWGELAAQSSPGAPFDREGFRALLPRLRRLTRQDPGQALARMKQLCREVGVVVVLTPEFKGTRLSGAARRLGDRRALIQLSLRHKTDDQLWFSFFHEAGHLLEGSDTDWIDLKEPDTATSDGEEEIADRFARETLIGGEPYERFVASKDFTASAVRALAKAEGISPGIVLGRLQRDGLVPWSNLNDLKKRIVA
jgi:HTH-type transcriptional regulator / antitoxin HigA